MRPCNDKYHVLSRYFQRFSFPSSVRRIFWDKSYYFQVFGNVDVDLGWIMLGVGIVFLSLSRIMEQLDEIKNKIGGEK